MSNHVAFMREAAAEMRRRANAATKGPWVTDVSAVWADGPGGTWVAETLQLDDPLAANANSEHVASWHPGVALLVADLLEGAAIREEEYQHGNPCRGRHGPDCACDPLPGDEAAMAVALAVGYLGRPADG